VFYGVENVKKSEAILGREKGVFEMLKLGRKMMSQKFEFSVLKNFFVRKKCAIF